MRHGWLIYTFCARRLIRSGGKHRYFAEQLVDPISITAGLVQTGLYLDFFYVYFTKYVARTNSCNFPCSDLVTYLHSFYSQGSPGPEVRVAGMTFDSHCPLYALPAQRWFRPVHGDKSQLELNPVSIVVFPSICTHARTLGNINMQNKNFKASPFYYNCARDIPAVIEYTIKVKLTLAPGPSTSSSIMYCPARSTTCVIAAPDRASVKAPDEATTVPPVTGNSLIRTNARVWGCKRILQVMGRWDL